MDHHVSSLVVRRWEEGAGEEEEEGAERKVGEVAERKVEEVGVGRELAVGELLLTFHLSIRWYV